MSTGTLDTAGTPNTGVATAPPGPPLDWDQDADLIWIKSEVERSTAIERDSEPIAWEGIRDRASRFVALTPDWILIVARARAAVHVDGMGQLPPALETLTTAASASWTTMQPALPRGLARRSNYLTWFIEGLAEAVSNGRVPASTYDAVKASIERLATLDEVLRPLMGAGYPGVRLLREALTTALSKATPAATTSAQPAQSTSSSAAAAAAPAAVEFPPPIDNEDTADRVLSKTRAALIAVADARQASDAGDALSYRLRRMALWLRQTTELPLDENGRLRVQGPSTDEQERVRGALDNDPKGVVSASEQLLEQYPLWLDANYLTFLALSRSGASSRAAADIVLAETLGLLQRFPSLPDLEFSDEVPVASPDTRDWLASEADKRGGGAPAPSSGPAASATNDELATAERTAGELAAQGQLEASFKLLDDGMREARSGRERFRWRLAAGRHAARQGSIDLAVNVFTGLDHEAKELRLDVWEPDLWAAVLTSMLELGHRKGRRDRLAPEVLALLAEVEQRLSRLDLMAALKLSKERG